MIQNLCSAHFMHIRFGFGICSKIAESIYKFLIINILSKVHLSSVTNTTLLDKLWEKTEDENRRINLQVEASMSEFSNCRSFAREREMSKSVSELVRERMQ